MVDYHKIPKLKGADNYKSWEKSLRSSLLIGDLYDVVDDAYKIPPDTYTEKVSTADGIPIITYEHYYKDFSKLNAKALAAIHITCSEAPYAQIETIETAQGAYKKLKELYGTDSFATREQAYFALQELRADQFKDLHEYLAKFREHQNKLNQMDSKLPDDIYAMIFKRGLPKHLESFVYTQFEIFRKDKKPIDLDYLTTSLANIDTATKADDTRALAGNFGKQAKKGNGKPSQNTTKKCGYCGAPGHDRDYCFHLHKDLAPEGFTSLSKQELKQREYKRKNKQSSDDKDHTKQKKDDEQHQNFGARSARFQKQHQKSSEIIIDSGDQEHINWDKNKFVSYTPVKNQSCTGIASEPITVKGIGSIIIPAVVNGLIENFEIDNVRHVPDADFNLLSTTQLDLAGYTHTGGHGLKTFYDNDDKVVLQGHLRDRTYFLDTMWSKPIRALRMKSSEPPKNIASWTEWHCRFGHISIANTKALAKATGVDCEAADRLQKNESNELCEGCVSGKITRIPSRQSMRKEHLTKGQMWHIDLTMASHVTTLGGHTNIMVLTDEATGFARQVLLKRRSELPDQLAYEFKHITNQGVKIAYVHGDNELIQGQRCKDLYTSLGIECLPTAAYNSSQNGIAERGLRTLFGRIRSVLISAGLPVEFWGEAAYYVTYVDNLIPKKDGKSPFELWFGRTPQSTYLKPFGCWCYAFNTSPHQKKLDNRAIKCRFLGHEGKSICRLYDVKKGAVIRSAHVVFDEKKAMISDPTDYQLFVDEPIQDEFIDDLLSDLTDDEISPESSPMGTAATMTNQESEGAAANQEPEGAVDTADQASEGTQSRSQNQGDTVHTEVADISNRGQSDQSERPNQPIPAPASPPATPVSGRPRRNQPRIDYKQANSKGIQTKNNPDGFRAGLIRVSTQTTLPGSIKEALSGPDSQKWRDGAMEELGNHEKQNTWNEPCIPPPHTNIISGRWVLSHKLGPMGEIIRHKARWVAKGFQQIKGIDFNETFSATLKASSWRMLLALIAKYGLECECSDVVAAFLEALVHEEIWIEQPHGFTNGNPKQACRLNKALYGLKQASYEWYSTLYTALKEMGFTRSEYDHCIFINHDTKVIIAAYVDDLLFIAHEKEQINEVKLKLSNRFNFKHLGDINEYLGMQIIRNRQNYTVQINQTKYAKQLLNQLGLDQCTPVKSPIEKGHIPPASSDYTAPANEIQAYQSMMGALNWLSIMTRPDISFAVSNLSRYLTNPSPHHVMAAKRVLRYIAGTINEGIFFGPGQYDGLQGFTDASYCDDVSTSRSTGAYIFKLFNGPIIWQSKLQKLVATSTCESEYIAAAEACKEALFLGPMLKELGFMEGDPPVLINIDNQAAMKLATNPINHSNTKHIRMRYHFVRQLVSETQEIRLEWVDTHGQAADPLTKAIGPINSSAARELLGMSTV